MTRNIRTMAVLASLLTLVSSFTYNIAITRKIPTSGLGLLSLLNATIAFSTLPTALISFAYPRLTARDNAEHYGCHKRIINLLPSDARPNHSLPSECLV
ncbi:hypothetical protein [Vulcanisaeta distributa]|uniref:hypothetical protein n=1 Tax=Vulcanisaeta distributa TaxID=164451 RepID=UPI001FB4F34D|nr:hypothetical protein [Vulcanisaeta distributa]